MARPRRRTWIGGTAALALAWTAALVLAIGLGRTLVVCVGDHAAARIEFAHAPGQCGAGADIAGAGDGAAVSAALPADHDDGGCVDRLLPPGAYTKPSQERGAGELHAAACVATATVAAPEPRSAPGLARASPPRQDHRTSARRSVVLLI